MLNEKLVQNLTANAEAAFTAAQAMATAKSLPELAKLQGEFVQKFAAQASEQTKEFFDLSTRATQHLFEKAQAAGQQIVQADLLNARRSGQEFGDRGGNSVAVFLLCYYVIGRIAQVPPCPMRGRRDPRPHEAGSRATRRAQDQAVSRLQDAVPERMVRRAHLPSLQVRQDLAQRRRHHAAGPLASGDVSCLPVCAS
jgi:hypothetical protein